MSVIYILLPLALAFAGIAVGVFIWAARSGQFDDMETPAARILEDDEGPADRARSERSVPTGTQEGMDLEDGGPVS